MLEEKVVSRERREGDSQNGLWEGYGKFVGSPCLSGGILGAELAGEGAFEGGLAEGLVEASDAADQGGVGGSDFSHRYRLLLFH